MYVRILHVNCIDALYICIGRVLRANCICTNVYNKNICKKNREINNINTEIVTCLFCILASLKTRHHVFLINFPSFTQKLLVFHKCLLLVKRQSSKFMLKMSISNVKTNNN